MNTKQVLIRLSPDEVAQVDALAKAETRTRANVVKRLVEIGLRAYQDDAQQVLSATLRAAKALPVAQPQKRAVAPMFKEKHK